MFIYISIISNFPYVPFIVKVFTPMKISPTSFSIIMSSLYAPPEVETTIIK